MYLSSQANTGIYLVFLRLNSVILLSSIYNQCSIISEWLLECELKKFNLSSTARAVIWYAWSSTLRPGHKVVTGPEVCIQWTAVQISLVFVIRSLFLFWWMECECRTKKPCSVNNEEATTWYPLPISLWFYNLNHRTDRIKQRSVSTLKVELYFNVFPSPANK